VTAIPAATLIILRDRSGAPPDLLTVVRANAMAFAGGATVFPGGRIDPSDRALAQTMAGGDPDDRAARIAAIRETLEEAGLAIGFAATPPPPEIDRMRAALHAGRPFGAVLAEAGARLAPEQLVPFARWLPDHRTSRVFDTRFYLAALPPDAGEARVDGTENTGLGWSSAAALVAAADRGEAVLIFPTRRNLERLARFAGYADAAADARAHPIETITPWIEERGGRPHLCIPEGLGYPITAESLDRVSRG
jgi:8-oxo-dGTP pyrophosphatase MutT (NUDIX family)